jgi:IgGFc binding protein
VLASRAAQATLPRMKKLISCVALASLSVLVVLHCSSEDTGFGKVKPGASSSGTLIGIGDADTDASPATYGLCSPDLKSVLDPEGKVVTTCGPGEACGKAGCVSACQGARDNKSSVGCEYYAVVPDMLQLAQGSCHAAFVVNASDVPAKLEVERAGKKYDVSKFARVPVGSGPNLVYGQLPGGDTLQPGQLAILFLNHKQTTPIDFLGQKIDYNCPKGVTAALDGEVAGVYGTGLGEAFKITSTAPISAYDIYPFGGGASANTGASLLLPSSVADINYIGVSGYGRSAVTEEDAPFLQILATEDNTQVRIKPIANIEGGGGVPKGSAGQITTLTLKRGQYMQISQNQELSGSPIESDKPVLVVGGNRCMNIGLSQSACDNAHQFLPPVKALGTRYVAVPHPERVPGVAESPPWRIVGAVKDTKLVYEPSAPAGAPTSLSPGQVVEFAAGTAFVVSSQDAEHPFYLSGHMTGGGGNAEKLKSTGDPEFVNVIPADQYLKSYVFFTDPTYPRTQIVVTRAKGKDGFKDVTLACAGVLSGWKPVGTSGQFETTNVGLAAGNYEKVGNCANGRQELSSEAPVGITVWGWGQSGTTPASSNVSYAYPAGASVRPITAVVVPVMPN